MMDCRVLAQLIAEIALQRPESAASIATFESLLPSPHELEELPMIPMRRVDPPLRSRAPELYQRFPNNNHVIQIHLRAIGVAILPLTSRLLNHSCSPNAVLRYILSASQQPRAEVVTIREISEGEEVRCRDFIDDQNNSSRIILSLGLDPLSRPRDLLPRATEPTRGCLRLRLLMQTMHHSVTDGYPTGRWIRGLEPGERTRARIASVGFPRGDYRRFPIARGTIVHRATPEPRAVVGRLRPFFPHGEIRRCD